MFQTAEFSVLAPYWKGYTHNLFDRELLLHVNQQHCILVHKRPMELLKNCKNF